VIFILVRMNHLTLPIHDLTRPAIQIPYLCTPQFSYDDLGFITYPQRTGIDLDYLCRNDQTCVSSLEPFLQAWLWCGLLGETLGVGSRGHIKQKIASLDSFTTTSDTGTRIICTNNLRDVVIKRRQTTISSTGTEEFRRRFDICLEIAAHAVNSILETPTCQKQLAQMKSLQDCGSFYSILLSVQILIETLRSNRSFLFLSQLQHSLPRMAPIELNPTLLDILCGEAGWCQFQSSRIESDLQIKFFLSSTLKHERCKQLECRGDGCPGRANTATAQRTMRPHHTTAACSCEMVQVGDDVVEAITREDLVVLLTYYEASGGQRSLKSQTLDLRSSSSDQPFVAFSHIRNRGLGNTTGHGLPHCQLALLQEIANDAVPSTSQSVPFYIDTICVPLGVQEKKNALNLLPKVFREASAVVVLDPVLMTATVGSDVDCLIRMRYSDWKTRLWTLQEGSLAKKLLFRFANRIVDIDELLQRFDAEAPLSILAHALDSHQPAHDPKFMSRLLAFNRDLKSSKDLSSVAGPDTKIHMRAWLRLGYLAVPRFRYLQLNTERVQASRILYALESCYWEGLTPVRRDQNAILERLNNMYHLADCDT